MIKNMELIIFFQIKDIRNAISEFLTLFDIEHLRLVNNEYAKIFKELQLKKLCIFKRSLNYREDIFARPYYPKNIIKEIYQKENVTYSNGHKINVYWNKKIIGFIRFRKFGESSLRNNWNGYFYMESNNHKYDEDNQLSLQKYRG